MSTVLANPAEMIAHGAPRVIHNDAELEMYTDALFRLTALESPSGSEVEAIELLTLLVELFVAEPHRSCWARTPAGGEQALDGGKSLVISIVSAIYSRKANACSIKKSACSSPRLPWRVKST